MTGARRRLQGHAATANLLGHVTSSSRPYRVLVVCTGNTCRTPMAEALLRRMFDEAGIEAEVRSAGTHAVDGGRAHPLSEAVVREAGLDLGDFRSRQLTPERVRWADTVLGMQHAHVRRALELDETVDAHVLTEFAPPGDRDRSASGAGPGIQDPIGREREVYDLVFEQIHACLGQFVERKRSAEEPGSQAPDG